ncbi:MAG: thiamine pyrophosphate-dependent enzyme [Planctomycetota bacterium]|jgi:2-oxoglutarate ferredoxin oxidoreductase subunit beta
MTETRTRTKKDYKTDQDVRWCPGCGDYGILNAVQSAFAKLGKSQHETVIVSGIGCSSRFPYYMETYGFHSIHGRAPAIATGVKIANPDLDVWVVTGDGDALSIGGNHFLHVIRRNVGVKIRMRCRSAATTFCTSSAATSGSRSCCSTTGSTASPRGSTRRPPRRARQRNRHRWARSTIRSAR